MRTWGILLPSAFAAAEPSGAEASGLAKVRTKLERVSQLVRYGFINGLRGFVTIEQSDTLQTTALQIDDGKIVAICVPSHERAVRPAAQAVLRRERGWFQPDR